VNYGSCGGFVSVNFKVVDPNSNIFKSPKKINIPAGNVLTIYDNASDAQQFYLPAPQADLNLLGQDVGGTPYYPITIEKNRFCVFGYFDAVDKMLPTGKDLMVNLVYSIGNLSL